MSQLTIKSLTLEETAFNYDGITSETISLSKATVTGNNGKPLKYIEDDKKFENIGKFELTPQSVTGLNKALVEVANLTKDIQIEMTTVTGASWTYGTTKTQTVKVTVTDAWEQPTELSFDLIFTSTIKE